MQDRQQNYVRLFLALTISLIVMFVLSMAFIARWDDFFLNLSNFYMAVTMVAPMGVIMLLIMWEMYPNKTLNIALIVGFVGIFFLGLWLGRAEIGVGNEQFLRAMIPHHSRAILVCENANITDADISELCDQIIAAQEREITLMKQMLEEQ